MSRATPGSSPPSGLGSEALRAGLAVFAAYHLGIAAFMAFDAHAFFTSLGPFDAYNSHYIHDTATFEAALGVGFLVSLRRPSWRVPVIAITTVQFALHTFNHLLDASRAHPESTGWLDFASLLASTLILAWMWREAAREQEPTRRRAASAGPIARATASPAERSSS